LPRPLLLCGFACSPAYISLFLFKRFLFSFEQLCYDVTGVDCISPDDRVTQRTDLDLAVSSLATSDVSDSREPCPRNWLRGSPQSLDPLVFRPNGVLNSIRCVRGAGSASGWRSESISSSPNSTALPSRRVVSKFECRWTLIALTSR